MLLLLDVYKRQMLDFVKGDKTALKAFIDKVSGLEADKYTEATWTPFNDALVAANNVYNLSLIHI